MKKIRKVFVAGPANAARSALVRRLKVNGLTDDQIDTREEDELNICDQMAIRSYLRKSTPDQIYITAGPWGNPSDSDQRRGSYLAEALLGPVQLIHEAMYAGVRKLLFVASHQIYGRHMMLPIAEEDLTHAGLDPLGNPLAIAHTAGIRLCEAYTHEFGDVLGLQYRSVVVGHLYGPDDDLDPCKAGELQALMRHIHQAKVFKLSSVSIGSNGLRRSDWLHADDMADACIKLLGLPQVVHTALTKPNRAQLNVGSGRACTTLELAQAVTRVVGYKGELKVECDHADDGQDVVLDTNRMRSTGWEPHIDLQVGLAQMYRDFKQQARKLTSARCGATGPR